MINFGSDIWECPTSYVISPELEVAVMVHIPVAQRSSYMYLYKYISTPLMAPEGSKYTYTSTCSYCAGPREYGPLQPPPAPERSRN